jgi:hypothetical protein
MRRSQTIDELTVFYARSNERVSGVRKEMRVIMTSIFKTPYGELQQFLQNLHSGGFTYEDILRVNKRPYLASDMLATVHDTSLITYPDWWRTAEQQLQRAHELWPNVNLPKPPAHFEPRTKSEVLLLHVPDTFDSLWDKVAPTGSTTHRWESVKYDPTALRLAPNKVEFDKPVWVAFDTEYGIGDFSDSLWSQADINLAASEVFSALIQFPDWTQAWRNGALGLNLMGYQLKHMDSWSDVLGVNLSKSRLSLRVDFYAVHSNRRPSPSVREC